jgi:4-coumarate--CoA ligase
MTSGMGGAAAPVLALGRDAILRVLRPLIAQDLGRITGRPVPPAESEAWPGDIPLAEEGLGLDSLGIAACAAAVDRLFHLHEREAEGRLFRKRRLAGWAAVVDETLQHGVSGFTFATSGSTGRPKPCTHALCVLLAEARHWAGLFEGRRRVVLAVPAHHIYGMIFGVLLPSALGVPVLERRAATPAGLLRDLRPGDLLVGFPAGHTLLAASGGAPPPDVLATSSTAPLPAATHRALRGMGFAGVTEVYGSSETAGIAMRRDPDAPFALLPRWRRGSGAEVVDAATGETAALPDEVAWEGERALRVLGRRDAAVQVGGMNVHPALVAEALRAHPGVAEAAVRLDSRLPEPRLKAFVVPASGTDPAALTAALDAWCSARLPAPERPVRFTLGTALPRDAMGKPADWEG